MQNEAQKLFEARVLDCVRTGETRPAFLGFLDLSERRAAEALLCRSSAENYRFFGGFPDAERILLGVFPSYIAPEDAAFPLSALSFSYRTADVLSHRDFLGACLSKGIQRASLGDILTEAGRTVLFVRDAVMPLLLSDIEKIGRVGVRVSEGFSEPLPAAHSFLPLDGVVASERLDCLVAFLTNCSREKAALCIQSGAVSVNHTETQNVSERVGEGSVLSIRRSGRFIIDTLGPKTKKGRLAIKCRKYV